MRSAISLDKVNLEYAETVKDKPTGKDTDFVTYSNTINFVIKWLDNNGYLRTQWESLVKEQAITCFKNWKEPKK